MSTRPTFVIVGAGLAGAKAAETLRAEGFDGRLLLFGEEAERPYERPPLSKAYLRGETDRHSLYVHPEEFYAAHDIELRPSTRVDSIAPASHQLELASGERIGYRRLLLATGATARRLRLPGADLGGVHYLRSRGDADALAAAAARAEHVVVVGTGWIGSEAAASLRQLGRDVTMVGPDPAPLARVLGPEVAGVYRDLHADHGVRLLPETRVAGFRGHGRVEAVVTEDGRTVEGDLVLVGAGAVPRTELAEAAGLPVAGGVLVDEQLEAIGAAGVYAVGAAGVYAVGAAGVYAVGAAGVYAAGAAGVYAVGAAGVYAVGAAGVYAVGAAGVYAVGAAGVYAAGAAGVYAAGDVAAAWHPRYQRYLHVEHWANALNQGPAAARNMLGIPTPYARLPYFYSDQYDLSMEYSGLAATWDRVVVRGDLAAREFIAFWLKDQRVVAGMNAGVWDVVPDIQALIRRGRPVDPARLADPDIPLDQVTGDQAGCVGGREHPMTKLYQLHELHGHRLWLDNLTRVTSARPSGVAPVRHRGFPGPARPMREVMT
jgi:3-phenylpropionate/trans-cinnamate dioxygenase ferredoxin reductase subunit